MVDSNAKTETTSALRITESNKRKEDIVTIDEQFIENAKFDPEFQSFVESVTPRETVQKVWLSELIMILRLLWAIYQLLKEKGIISRWLYTRHVRSAMKLENKYDQERQLARVRFHLS